MINTTVYRNRLEEMLQAITTELETIALYEPTTGDWVVRPQQDGPIETDENAEADTFEETEERQATAAELETTYRAITLALRKIESGTFGICEISGEPIESERLAFLPTARTCVVHKDEERMLPLA